MHSPGFDFFFFCTYRFIDISMHIPFLLVYIIFFPLQLCVDFLLVVFLIFNFGALIFLFNWLVMLDFSAWARFAQWLVVEKGFGLKGMVHKSISPLYFIHFVTHLCTYCFLELMSFYNCHYEFGGDYSWFLCPTSHKCWLISTWLFCRDFRNSA